MRAPYVHAPNLKDLPACDRAGRRAKIAGVFSEVTCPLCQRFPELWGPHILLTDLIWRRMVKAQIRKLYEVVFRKDLHPEEGL